MSRQHGIVLIISLVFLLVMSLLVAAMLLVTQLSHKTSVAGQQQLILGQEALQQHITMLQAAGDAAHVNGQVMSVCPAQYAAWSDGVLQCELLQLDSESYSANRHFYAAYSSLLLKQQLLPE